MNKIVNRNSQCPVLNFDFSNNVKFAFMEIVCFTSCLFCNWMHRSPAMNGRDGSRGRGGIVDGDGWIEMDGWIAMEMDGLIWRGRD